MAKIRVKQVSVWLVITSLWGWSWAGEKPKYGPEAVPLSLSHEYFRKNSAPTFWSLIPYYLPQRDGRSCSLASVSMIVNAARAGTKMNASQELATEAGVFKKVDDPVWKKGLGMMGQGVTLDEIGPLAEKSLKAYGIIPQKVEVVHMEKISDESRKKLHQFLTELSQSSQTLILANFNQAAFTGDAEVGHFAPIGAFDEKNQRALILDPDREWYEPYWVSEETLMRGMATADKKSHQNRGYVVIKLPERQLP